MRNLTAIRERYLRDELPFRLGGLAADLARIKSFSDHPNHRDLVHNLLNESKFFIEWTVPNAGLETQAALVELQVQLARWERALAKIWTDPVQRATVAKQAGVWSKRVLEMSGLLR